MNKHDSVIEILKRRVEYYERVVHEYEFMCHQLHMELIFLINTFAIVLAKYLDI